MLGDLTFLSRFRIYTKPLEVPFMSVDNISQRLLFGVVFTGAH
jgi:hypothetical protein